MHVHMHSHIHACTHMHMHSCVHAFTCGCLNTFMHQMHHTRTSPPTIRTHTQAYKHAQRVADRQPVR